MKSSLLTLAQAVIFRNWGNIVIDVKTKHISPLLHIKVCLKWHFLDCGGCFPFTQWFEGAI